MISCWKYWGKWKSLSRVRQPTRLLCPRDLPGKDIGVCFHLGTCIRQISGIEQSPKQALTYVVKWFLTRVPRPFHGERTVFWRNGIEKTRHLRAKKNGARPLLLLFGCSVRSDSLWPHGLQHARLPCPSPSPGACSNSCSLSQWCDPMDYTAHGILQVRILEWVVFPFSRGSSQLKNQTQVSHIAGRFFTSWATRGSTTKNKNFKNKRYHYKNCWEKT